MANTLSKEAGRITETVPSAVYNETKVIPLTGGYSSYNALIVEQNVTAITGSGAKVTTTVEDSVDGTTWNSVEALAAVEATGTKVLRITKPFSNKLRLNVVIAGTTPEVTAVFTVNADHV